jgi:hypothetical protein
MKKISLLVIVVVLSFTSITFAGAPFNNLEGVGGVAFNPLAYVAGGTGDNEYLQNPQFGSWYVNLNQVDVNLSAIGVSDTLFNRLELSYGFEAIGQQDAANHNKHNIGGKLLLLPENFKDINFLPAVSVGAIYKNTDHVVSGAKKEGWDFYLVATKLITQLPVPVLISGGLLETSSYVTGVFGYDSDLKATLFGNLDFVLGKYFIAGAEYKQGPKFDAFNNADYWDVHLAFTPNKNLTLIGAYVDAGDYKSTDKVGLGNGVVLSAQYAF